MLLNIGFLTKNKLVAYLTFSLAPLKQTSNSCWVNVAKEQFDYLKRIALITKIPEDAVLIRDVEQLFTHELGHLNHKLTPADEAYLTSKAVIDEHRNNVAIQNTCSKITPYAKQSPKEFVAEVYSGLISGQKFSDDVMALYKKYGGPALT